MAFDYYYNGYVCWSLFFPFHSAISASDLIDLSNINIKFDLNSSLFAFQPLLSVLPPYNAKVLLKCLEKVMKDPLSSSADFYPFGIKIRYK